MTTSSWDFVSAVAEQSSSLILLDLNNVYVSSVNHGFDPKAYLRALPANRVQQIHLAGHSVQEGIIIVAAGSTFGEVCEQAAAGAPDAAVRIGACLHHWMGQSMLADSGNRVQIGIE